MKRLLAIALVLSLLLIGCNKPGSGETQSTLSTEPQVATQPITEPVTEPSLPSSDNSISVYLLERVEYLHEDSVAFTCTYTYDNCGNVLTAIQQTAEGEIQCTTYYEEQDEKGMPHKIREVWDVGNATPRILTYLEDGKIESELYEGQNNSGWWYDYDEQGNLSQMRLYFENSPDITVYCEYENGILSKLYCKSIHDDPVYEAELKDGRILKKTYYDNITYSYLYEYDENGNLASKRYENAETQRAVARYIYTEVQISSELAPFALAQQQFLLGMMKGEP